MAYKNPDTSELSEKEIEKRKKELQSRRKARLRKTLSTVFTLIVMLLIVVVFFIPFLWTLGNSFRPSTYIWSNVYPVTWKTFIPGEEFTLEGYKDALGFSVIGSSRGMNLARSLMVSGGTAICVVCLSLFFNTCAAYFFGRLKFPGKKYLMAFVLITMMIPQQVVIVPLFMVIKEMGLYDTFWAMVVPWYSSPFIVFALTQFLSELPYELDEAAIMDGANLWQILWHVVVPNSLPGLITVSLLEFQFIWNGFYWPLIAVASRNLQPVQVAIAMQFSENEANWGRVFSAIVLASLPVIILFLALQRYYFENVAMSGVKG
jgi:ABC-type glycerol-3-phosphate transport system permease component